MQIGLAQEIMKNPSYEVSLSLSSYLSLEDAILGSLAMAEVGESPLCSGELFSDELFSDSLIKRLPMNLVFMVLCLSSEDHGGL